jgi:UDP-glucose 4-epimerase
VREVIGAVERAAGHSLATREFPRRAGDLPAVVADSSRLKARLGWTPRHDDLEEIVRHALAWERRQLPLAAAP